MSQLPFVATQSLSYREPFAVGEVGGVAVSAIAGVGAVLIFLATALFYPSRRKT